MAKAQARSPYQRKQKRPYAYSEQYRSWRAAVAKGSATSLEARDASKRHSARFLGTQAQEGAQAQ